MSFVPPTGLTGRLLAMTITILGAALLWLGVIAPLRDWYDDRADQLRQQQMMVRKMSVLVDSLPALRQQAAAATAGDDAGDQHVLLAGATDSLAAASLQQRIDDLAAASGVRVDSEEILTARPAGSLRAISVRLTMNAPFAALVDLMTGLAKAETPMIVDDVTIHAGFREAGSASGNNPVDTSFTVTAFRTAREDAR
jgi:hypothetical protein